MVARSAWTRQSLDPHGLKPDSCVDDLFFALTLFSMLLVYIRSTLFFLWFAVASFVIAVGGVWVLLLPRRATEVLSKTWSRAILFGLKWIVDLECEVRGTVPKQPVLIASKHMSMW